MENEMRGISCCGDCINYSLNKHKCLICKEAGDPRNPFYDDCPLPKVVEVVRCRECKHARDLTLSEAAVYLEECRVCKCPDASIDGYNVVMPEHFCSYGEKRCENAD